MPLPEAGTAPGSTIGSVLNREVVPAKNAARIACAEASFLQNQRVSPKLLKTLEEKNLGGSGALLYELRRVSQRSSRLKDFQKLITAKHAKKIREVREGKQNQEDCYSVSVQLQSAGTTWASRKSPTRL